MSDAKPNPPSGAALEAESDRRSGRWSTVPNLLCVVRLLVSPLLVVLAWADRPRAFVALFISLTVTDWIDGKIARVFTGQRSHVGPRLDSAADAVMYAALTLGAVWMRWDLVRQEIGLLAALVGSYVVAVAVALIRLRVWPSYHTRLAKASWLLVAVAVIAALLEWSPWPLRVALVLVTLTNLETLAISLLLEEPKTNVKSLVSVIRHRRDAGSR